MAYVLGRCEFWGLTFEVTPEVLVPRPETEILVEQALQRLDVTTEGSAGRTIVDVGTGSGCIAVSLAVERPRARVVATDLSPAALAVARRNAVRHGVEERVSLIQADLVGDVIRSADAIVSNPPYVPLRDRSALPPEVRDHEPARALYGGEDGLDVIRRLVAVAADRLAPGGWLLLEFGYGQDAAVRALMAASPFWTDVTVTPDLQGIPRVAAARRQPGSRGFSL
jgi:release factor glutamine methyltransferase